MKAAREMHVLPEFDAAEHGLKKIRLVSYMGLVFINCDPNAVDFLGPLSNLEKPLGAYRLDEAKVAFKTPYRIQATWKLVLANYL